jgi:putative ABC transport system permease protein
MFKNFLTIALRNLFKNKGYLVINILGLAIGLTSFIFIALYVINELSYDRYHSRYEDIYRVKVKGQMSGQVLDQAVTAAPMAKALVADYPEVEQATRISRWGAWLIRYKEKGFNEDGVLFADSNIFRVFDFKMIRGNPATALVNPKSMVLTQSTAKRYFGNEDPMGKMLIVESDTILYTVTGILEDVPSNSHFHFDMLGSMCTYPFTRSNEWLSHNYYTYIILKKGTDPVVFERKMQQMAEKYVGPQIKRILGITISEFRRSGDSFGYYLQPLKDIHLNSNIQVELEPNGSMAYVRIFSIVAIFILVLAIINFVNLATAKSTTRAREVGVRKTLGSTRRGLIFQFIGESVLLAVIATIIATILVAILTPNFNQLLDINVNLSLFEHPLGLVMLLLLAVVVGIMAGIYPAFVLAAFNPITVLKGLVHPVGKSGGLRSFLVVLQFVISITIIIGTIVISRQLNYMLSKELGFNKDQLLIVRRPDALKTKIEPFKVELMRNPNIGGVANATAIPGKTHNNNGFLRDGSVEKNTYLMLQNIVSFEYPEVLGLQLVQGRFFSREFKTDSMAIIINEAAVKALGLKDPIGKFILQPGARGTFFKYPVIGVVKDFNIESLHKEIAPACFNIMRGNQEGYLLIRLKASNMKETLAYIEKTWKRYANKQPFQSFFFDKDFAQLYRTEMKIEKLFTLFAILAIFIACLGLLGLITYTSVARTREIGLRKVMGASIPNIIMLLSTEVVKLILIATIVAWVIAYLCIRYWLQSFADHIEVSWLTYVLATLVSLLIGWISISFQAIRVALSNPVEALKYE